MGAIAAVTPTIISVLKRLEPTTLPIPIYGSCYGRYGFTKTSEDGLRPVIDFDWIFEATAENLEKLVKEMLRRFNA